MRIEAIEPTNDEAFAHWFAFGDAAHREVWGDDGSAWKPDEWRAEMLGADDTRYVPLLATDAGEPVGSACLGLPVRGNTHFADLTLAVSAEHRRRGVGAALLANVEGLAEQERRTTICVDIEERARSTDAASTAFARRHGYAIGQVNHRRDLALPLDEETARSLEQSSRPYAAAYSLRSWQDRCPDDLVEDLAVLKSRMMTDAPMGALALGEEPWDTARVRAGEAVCRAQGRTSVVTGALSVAGRLVGFTDLRVSGAGPQRAFQWDTLVLAEHRGHRLGTLLKVANARTLAAASPSTTVVTTFNAEDNGPMLAVNEALGFHVVGTLTTWQKTLR